MHFVIVALPGLFSYLFLYVASSATGPFRHHYCYPSARSLPMKGTFQLHNSKSGLGLKDDELLNLLAPDF